MKVVSFNVLADAYTGYGDYSHVSSELLELGARNNAIVRLLRKLDADVFGLQEADETLVAELHDTEWQSFWTRKGNNKTDGCLTLVKHGLAVNNFRSYEYGDGSGHVAQFIEIGKVVLANTHIKWAPPDSSNHIGVHQAKELLDNLNYDSAVIFADCNDRPGGPVRQAIAEAGFLNLCGDSPTALVDQEPIALDLLAIRGIAGRNVTQNYDLRKIPNVDCPSDHIPVEAELDM